MDENNMPLGEESQDETMTSPTDAGGAPVADESTAEEKMPDSTEDTADAITEGEAPAM